MQKTFHPIRLALLACILLIFVVFSARAQDPAQPGQPSQTQVESEQPSAQPSDFTFAVFGDNRPGLPSLTQPKIFKTILKDILKENPCFVVNTGDSVFGSSNIGKLQKQYAKYLENIKILSPIKVYLTLGNHEISGSKSNQAFFAKEFGALYYSFDRGDSHFIILNTEVVGEAGRIAGKQLEWLKEDLKKSKNARHKFIFVHRPMYPVSSHIGDSLDSRPKERDALHSLFVQNRITAVIAGHEHLFDQQIKHGVRYIITGGAGAPLYTSRDKTGYFNHYILVSIKGDKVDFKVIKPAMNGKPREVLPPEEAG